GTEGDGLDRSGVRAQRLLRLSRLHGPGIDQAVLAAGGEGLAVRAERQRPGRAGDKIANDLAGRDVPENDLPVHAAGSQQPAVGAEGHRPTIAAVLAELSRRRRGRARLGLEVPKADLAVEPA